ncbi:ABC-2 type transport system permease protein [Stackebrandtia albiflava]|uniref:ABC-2 type transport system permease protein n=1 Tax=Stackebrandtia albiflava TaxID=406432 RepID=A0A562VHJ3_9ACTN|nr:ABC transporter permease [Stackebrandtia albiflava]TWJ17197.1 ABC-2 type transport system permease protein [Stackebrandtia albiflava]
MQSFRSLTKAMFLGFVRDKVSLFFTIVFPLMFLVIFGALFQDQGTSPARIVQVGDVAVLDDLRDNAPDSYEALFEVTRSDDLDAAVETVRQGDADAAVSQNGETVTVHYSAADRTNSAVVLSTLNGVVDAGNLQRLQVAAPDVPVTTVDNRQVEDESLSAIQYLTPGLLGWAVSISGVFGAAATLVDWRSKKLLRRLRLAPVSIPEVIGARISVSLATAMIQLAVFIGVASLPVFGLSLTSYWWMAIPVLLVGTMAFLALGMVIGAIARTGEGASGLANLVVMPMAFASGSFFPLDMAPDWLKTISWISPLRYINDALLSVMVRGNDPLSVLPQIGLLVAFTLVVGFVAWRMFRWDDL